MQSKQSVWPTILCVACLIAAAATICLQKRSGRLVTASITNHTVDAEIKPTSILKGTNLQISVFERNDGFRFTVADLNGKQLAPNLTLSELAYEYPELRKLVKSELSQ